MMKKRKLLLFTFILVNFFSSCQLFSDIFGLRVDEGEEHDGKISLETNRTEGVAPLSVSFDLTNSSFYGDESLMLAEFMWDFGDDGDEYNIGKGYCPSHVYREPGTYTATVTAYYDDVELSETVEITVSDFSGTTYYISADGSDNDDGLSEDTPFATPAYAFSNFLDENVRFLLRQGDTFTQNTGIIFGSHGGDTVHGPVIFNSYKDSDNPSDIKPVIYDTRTNSSSVAIFTILNVDDFRVINLKMQATGGGIDNRDTDIPYPQGITMSAVTPSANCLLLDCDFQGCGSSSIHIEGEYHVVQDCTVRDGGSYGVYEDEGINCAFIGLSMKEFSNDSPEYTMRLSTHIVKNYVAYCDLWGDYTKCTFQIRGDDSSWNYVYQNQIDRFAGINTTNNAEDEYLHHNTFDSNIVVMRDYDGNCFGSYDQYGLFFESDYSIFRNNIVYGFDHGFGLSENTLSGSADHIWIHNNTVIAFRENCNFLSARRSSQDIELRNNIFYNSSSTSSYDDKFISLISAIDWPERDLNEYDSDYNILFGEAWGDENSKVIVGVADYIDDPTLEEWRSNFNNGTNSLFADASLNTTINTDNVSGALSNGFASVGAGSPAVDMGDSDRIWSRFDFFGNERSDLTIGAIGN